VRQLEITDGSKTFLRQPTKAARLGRMPRVILGVICGLVFGVLDIAIMLPMSFPDKKAAIAGAFFDRFAIGFLICVADLPWPGWVIGLVVGLLISLPSAIITKAYPPILGLGALGGIIIGIVRAKFAR
jgi:hypothetical protein